MNLIRPDAVSYRHVARCVDASDASRLALATEAQICDLAHGTLTTVHVAPSASSYPRLPASAPQSPVAGGEAHRPGWELLRNAKQRIYGEHGLLERNPPAAVACSWAGEEGVDLLVAAVHRGRRTRMALGSVAGERQ